MDIIEGEILCRDIHIRFMQRLRNWDIINYEVYRDISWQLDGQLWEPLGNQLMNNLRIHVRSQYGE